MVLIQKEIKKVYLGSTQVRPQISLERPDIDQYSSVGTASLISGIHGIAVDEDGNNLYVGPSSGQIVHYSLTGGDITTATQVDTSSSIYTRGLYVKRDGDKLYSISDNNNAYTITMSTPFSLSGSTSSSISLSSLGLTNPCGCRFTPDGDYYYCVDYSNSKAYKIPLSTARDITTGSTTGMTSISLSGIGALYNIAISPTGLKMFIGIRTNVIRIYQYNLGTAWDITTATDSGKSKTVSGRGTFTVTKGGTMYQANTNNSTVTQFNAS